MHVQGWFRDPAHRASGRIDFDKRTQSFDETTAHRLLNLADPHANAHVPVAELREELLTSNLLPVSVPDIFFSAATTFRDPRKVFEAQRESEKPTRYDFILRDGRIYCWLPPESTALASVVSGPTDIVSASHWGASEELPRQRAFVQLLNYALRQDLIEDCQWHPGRKILYFRAPGDMKTRSVRSISGRPVQVFNPHYKKDHPKQVSYCKHAALEWQFLQADAEWFCVITPTYHYTRDGVRDSFFISDLLTGIKLREKNPAVYSQTRLWASVLQAQEDVIDPRDTILTFGNLATYTSDRSINDKAWSFDPRKASSSAVGDDPPEAVRITAHSSVEELALFEVEA
jgi:hypothetical protein